MIIRLRSPMGMARVKAQESDLLVNVVQEACQSSGITYESLKVGTTADSGQDLSTFETALVADLGLKHGDMLYLTPQSSSLSNAATASQAQPIPVAQSVNGSVAINAEIPTVPKELEVDLYLEKQNGYIRRPKASLCRHGDKGMCEYCSPIPPWDRDYLDEKGIKHKSFHAHLKELNELQNNKSNGSSYIAPLSEPSYVIKHNCPAGHAPYPKGICSKCQPAPITLQQQKFRMVDHLEYADHAILNNFIDIWRQTGVQRYGVLYGHYEPYEEVPLGVKAVVEAIYEPPQVSELDGITLLEWQNEATVNKVAENLGLVQVGMVFTDLTDSGNKDGTVLCKRHKDSFFLSCMETIMAARSQIKHRNASKFSDTGLYSSKFVTCVITGGLQGEIEPRAYQVSTSAEALVKADDIGASTHPNMIYIKETSGSRYVPDVFYSKINEYGLEVKENAKPAFPVDFLLVTLSDAFPINPAPMFTLRFPIELRDFMGELQDLKAVRSQLQSGTSDSTQLCDFHFLIYVVGMEVLSGEETEMLMQFVRTRNTEAYVNLVQTNGWMTLLTILDHA